MSGSIAVQFVSYLIGLFSKDVLTDFLGGYLIAYLRVKIFTEMPAHMDKIKVLDKIAKQLITICISLQRF